MATDNRKLIEKADMGLQELSDGGGALTTANAQRFMRRAITAADFLSQCNVRPLRAPSERVSVFGLSNRVLRAGTPATELAQNQRTAPDLGFVELNAKLFKGEVRIPDEDLEDNIEQGNLSNVILEMIPDAVGRDIDELLLNGDTDSADAFLAQLDGVPKQITSHTVDFNNSRVSFSQLGAMLRALPKNYRSRMRGMYRYITSFNAEDDYRGLLDARETPGGDASIQGDTPVKYRGTPIIPCGLMPDDLDDGAGHDHQTNILLMVPKMVTVGFWRDIRVEVDRNKREGSTSFIVTCRLDCKVSEEQHAVKGTEVLNS